MFNLLVTILLNALLFIMFKLFPRFNIDSRQAIAVNYWTCAITGFILIDDKSVVTAGEHFPLIPWAILMGIMFVAVFNLMALSTQKKGITATTVANKLSLVIPVIFSVILYNEQLNTLKLAGILIAFPAVYFSTKTGQDDIKKSSLLLPSVIFFSSGLLDTFVKYVEHHYLQTTYATITYTIYLFCVAAIAGSIAAAFMAIKNKTGVPFRNIAAGILLGIPNYFSIYFLVKLLSSDFLQSSAAIPINNIGIVLACAIAGIFLFREKTSAARIIGLILSILAIILIAYADLNGRSI